MYVHFCQYSVTFYVICGIFCMWVYFSCFSSLTSTRFREVNYRGRSICMFHTVWIFNQIDFLLGVNGKHPFRVIPAVLETNRFTVLALTLSHHFLRDANLNKR